MRDLWTAVLFCLGLVAGVSVLFLSTIVVSQLWLPILAGTLLTAIMSASNWTSPSLRTPFAASIVSGMTVAYLFSTEVSAIRHAHFIVAILELGLALTFCWGFITAIVSRKIQSSAVSKAVPSLIAVVVMATIVGYASSGNASAGNMVRWISGLGFSRTNVEHFVAVLRKTIHFCFYGTFGSLCYRVGFTTDRSRSVAAAMAATFALASFDELRQSSIPSRSGSFTDVLLDISGAVTFVLIAIWLDTRPTASRKSETA